jgi:hypothetical protein
VVVGELSTIYPPPPPPPPQATKPLAPFPPFAERVEPAARERELSDCRRIKPPAPPPAPPAELLGPLPVREASPPFIEMDDEPPTMIGPSLTIIIDAPAFPAAIMA